MRIDDETSGKRKNIFAITDLIVAALTLLLFIILFMVVISVLNERQHHQIHLRMVCLVNLRSLGTAFTAYANDYNDSLPQPKLMDPSSKNEKYPLNFTQTLLLRTGIIDNPEIYFCPSNSYKRLDEDDFINYYNVNLKDTDNNSYFDHGIFNRVMEADSGWARSDYFWLLTYGLEARKNEALVYKNGPYAGKKIFHTKLKNVSGDTPLVTDMTWEQNGNFETFKLDSVEVHTNHLTPKGRPKDANILFGDGHVETKTFDQLNKNFTDTKTNTNHYW